MRNCHATAISRVFCVCVFASPGLRWQRQLRAFTCIAASLRAKRRIRMTHRGSPAIHAAMKHITVLAAVLASVSPVPVFAQLLSERPEGLMRVCVYAGPTAVLSAPSQREYRVGQAQNCPITRPPTTQGAAPPTAQLQSDRATGPIRECVYEQAGMLWTVELPAGRYCPLSRGMVHDEPAQHTGIHP